MTVPLTLQAFRAFCGAPAMAVEACPICRDIPRSCSRFEKGGELQHDTIPPAVGQLQGFLDEQRGWRGNVLRCPTCHRLYWYESEYEFLIGGSEDTWSYQRMEVDELFRSPWFTRLRVAPRALGYLKTQAFFRGHVFLTFDQEPTWHALADEGTLTALASLDALAAVIALDPPDLTDRLAYATFVDRVTSAHPSRQVDAFDQIAWRERLADDERLRIEDLRAASRVEPERVAERGGSLAITRWVVMDRQLICRVLTVLPSGEVRREDAVVGAAIPVDHIESWRWERLRRPR